MKQTRTRGKDILKTENIRLPPYLEPLPGVLRFALTEACDSVSSSTSLLVSHFSLPRPRHPMSAHVPHNERACAPGAPPLRDAAAGYRWGWGAEAATPLRDAAAGSRGDGEEQRQPLLLVVQQLEPGGDGEDQRRSWGAEGASGSAPPPHDAAAEGQEETGKSRKGRGEEDR